MAFPSETRLQDQELDVSLRSLDYSQRWPLFRSESAVRIIVSSDAERYITVDITGAQDGSFIRGRIYSKVSCYGYHPPHNHWNPSVKLSIPDGQQLEYSIYPSEIGAFAIGGSLTDTQLFELCHGHDDSSGTLTFFVSPFHDQPPKSWRPITASLREFLFSRCISRFPPEDLSVVLEFSAIALSNSPHSHNAERFNQCASLTGVSTAEFHVIDLVCLSFTAWLCTIMYPVTSNVLHLFLLKHRRSIRFLQCGGIVYRFHNRFWKQEWLHSFPRPLLSWSILLLNLLWRRVDESECNIGAEQVSSPDARPKISEQKWQLELRWCY